MINVLLQLDGNILLFIQKYIRQDWMNPAWIFITSLGDGGQLWLITAVLLLIPKKTNHVGVTAILAVAIGALITNVALKNMVARIRPYEVVSGLEILIRAPHDYSFPSGHTCSAFSAALVYYRMLPRKWGITAVIIASLIAFSRLYLGVHYPSDVLGGILAGAFAAWTGVKVNEYMEKKLYHTS
jgi:membrane-associated phospholipid phosphatase